MMRRHEPVACLWPLSSFTLAAQGWHSPWSPGLALSMDPVHLRSHQNALQGLLVRPFQSTSRPQGSF